MDVGQRVGLKLVGLSRELLCAVWVNTAPRNFAPEARRRSRTMYWTVKFASSTGRWSPSAIV